MFALPGRRTSRAPCARFGEMPGRAVRDPLLGRRADAIRVFCKMRVRLGNDAESGPIFPIHSKSTGAISGDEAGDAGLNIS